MRHIMMPLLALLILGPHLPQLPQPKNFTPVPVARGCRPSNACMQRCNDEGQQDCLQRCNPCRQNGSDDD
jgi:hypothetical protein